MVLASLVESVFGFQTNKHPNSELFCPTFCLDFSIFHYLDVRFSAFRCTMYKNDWFGITYHCFFNVNIFIKFIFQLVSLKNFILVGDAMNSVDLLMYQQDYKTLAVISRYSINLSEMLIVFWLSDKKDV